ncbi:MAG: hypothetical protein AAB608_00355 [Patescibacteria group bacterium]
MAFPSLEEDILRAIAYGQSVGFPLTLSGIAERVQCPRSLDAVVLGVENLAARGVISSWHGRFGIRPETRALIEEYESRAALTRVKWLHALRALQVLAWVPWIRVVWVSGSLAYDASDADGDVDVVCLVMPGHIFSARFCALVLTSLSGVRRAAHDVRAPDKLCMNHWIVDDGSALRHQSIYTAWVYAHMVPVYGAAYAQQWIHHQAWMGKYLAYRAPHSPQRVVRVSRLSVWVKRFFELALFFAEPFAQRIQVGRIARGVATVGRGRIQATHRVLEFHPRSQEGAILKRYEAFCDSAGIVVRAPDSGLGSDACEIA